MVQALFGHRQANQPAAILGHEIDQFRGNFFGGESQIAFVLAILIVHHHDHAAGANLLDGGRYVRECRLRGHYNAIVANARTAAGYFANSRSAPRKSARSARTIQRVSITIATSNTPTIAIAPYGCWVANQVRKMASPSST